MPRDNIFDPNSDYYGIPKDVTAVYTPVPMGVTVSWSPVLNTQLYEVYYYMATWTSLGTTGVTTIFRPGGTIGERYKVRARVGGIWSDFSAEVIAQ